MSLEVVVGRIIQIMGGFQPLALGDNELSPPQLGGGGGGYSICLNNDISPYW